ncbi:MAG: hypothetical protein C4334_06235 [Pyrinomonas sp.]|uniref:hypothetical protein n=1 Tax=Pyrinomonas sp. TaxID=2080306 RepID=UPI003333D883
MSAQSVRSHAKAGPYAPDVIFVPTPTETVMKMLRLAEIKPNDLLYDLGSDDGRIPITAAKLYGIRAVDIEIDPKMIEVARARARQVRRRGLRPILPTPIFFELP